MTAHHARRWPRDAFVAGHDAGASRHVAWLAGGLLASFLVPFVFADALGLQRDLYYAVYVAFVAGLVEDAAGHPGGIEFALALVRRGLVYGAADGLLLAAFPVIAVFAAFTAHRGTAAPCRCSAPPLPRLQARQAGRGRPGVDARHAPDAEPRSGRRSSTRRCT